MAKRSTKSEKKNEKESKGRRECEKSKSHPEICECLTTKCVLDYFWPQGAAGKSRKCSLLLENMVWPNSAWSEREQLLTQPSFILQRPVVDMRDAS